MPRAKILQIEKCFILGMWKDTNILIEILKGNQDVVQKLESLEYSR
jgi:hypothetical protein